MKTRKLSRRESRTKNSDWSCLNVRTSARAAADNGRHLNHHSIQRDFKSPHCNVLTFYERCKGETSHKSIQTPDKYPPPSTFRACRRRTLNAGGFMHGAHVARMTWRGRGAGPRGPPLIYPGLAGANAVGVAPTMALTAARLSPRRGIFFCGG